MPYIKRSILLNNDLFTFLAANKEFVFIFVIASLSAIIFTFNGFVTGDSIRYALELMLVKDLYLGLKFPPNVFNSEMCFGYYLVLNWLRWMLNPSEIIRLMNGVSAVASVVMISFLFMFVRSLFNDKITPLFTSLAVIFSPAVWMISHYGNPNILAMACFLGTLYIFDRIVRSKFNCSSQLIYWTFFIMLCLAAVTIRVDVVLAFGAYLGILYYRQAMSRKLILELIIALFIVAIHSYLLRIIYLGYFFNPSGIVANHLATRLSIITIYISLLINLSLLIMGANLLIFILAIIGLFRFGLRSRIACLFYSWVIPFLVFIPFKDMDISRLTAPIIPVICLMAILYLKQKFASARRPVSLMFLILILAQLPNAAIFYPAMKLYSHLAGKGAEIPLAAPMGFIPLDHAKIQRSVRIQDDIARQVAAERRANVLIMDFDINGMYYIYHILTSRNISSGEIIRCNDVNLKKYVTKENEFYIMGRGGLRLKHPISMALNLPGISIDKIHMSPLLSGVRYNQLYLEDDDIKKLIQKELSTTTSVNDLLR